MLLLITVGLSACVTSREQAPQVPAAVAATPAAILADSTAVRLAYLARHEAARLDEVLPELSALADALSGPASEQNTSPMLVEQVEPVSETVAVAPPPDDMLSAPSLRHGAHLASYRLEANARSGWRELQGLHPELLAHEARLETRDLGERGVFLRLKVGPFDNRAAAQGLCATLGARDQYCLPVDFSGIPLTDSGPGAEE